MLRWRAHDGTRRLYGPHGGVNLGADLPSNSRYPPVSTATRGPGMMRLAVDYGGPECDGLGSPSCSICKEQPERCSS
jgi:hypothetical protein